MKNGVLIIECLEPHDPGSEGRILIEIFKLMEIESKLVRVSSIPQIVAALNGNKYKHVHISTHGVVGDKERFHGWWTPNGSGSKSILDKNQISLNCTCIVSTACRSGASGFARYVTNTWGSTYYIAPTGKPRFYNAILFSHIYYHRLFISRRGVAQAFESYQSNYKNPHGFTLFQRTAT